MSLLDPAQPLFGSLTGAVIAQAAWASTDPLQRAAVLSRAAQLILEREQEFVGWGSKETGGIAGKAAHEVG